MGPSRVRIGAPAKGALSELAHKQSRSMQSVLEDAIECYRRDMFFKELELAYDNLQADPQAWGEELAERTAWDTTLLDDLTENR